jgi:ribosomal protein S19
MTRSTYKPPYLLDPLSRKSTISPHHVSKTYRIHNGKEVCALLIKEEMVGKKAGVFLPTRKQWDKK